MKAISPAVEVEEYSKESPLRYYQRVFEMLFLSETKEYYLHVASKLVSQAGLTWKICLALGKEREEETALRKEKEAVCCYVHVDVHV